MADRRLEVVYRPIDSIRPDPKNSRTHSPKQVKELAAAITEFGWTNPILVDENGQIIAGHGRQMAARSLGHTEVACIILTGLSADQKRALVIADNRLAERAGWNSDVLAAELLGLKANGFDTKLTGFGDKDLDAMIGKMAEKDKPVKDAGEVDDIEEIVEAKGAYVLSFAPTFLPDDDCSDLHQKLGFAPLLPDMLGELPDKIITWAGADASGDKDDGETSFLYHWRSDSIRGMPVDRTILAFYVDDWRFETLWADPAKYIGKIVNAGFKTVVQPNFSMWGTMGVHEHIHQLGKARYLSRCFQEAGIKVIPDINYGHRGDNWFTAVGLPDFLPAASVQIQTVKPTPEAMQIDVECLSAFLDQVRVGKLLVYGGKSAVKVIEEVAPNCPVTYVENRVEVRRTIMDRRKVAQARDNNALE